MKKSKVKQISQQLLIALVMFSLVFPGSLWAKKEKAGARIIVTKEDGQELKGELLKVEDDLLSLLMPESLAKVSIEVDEVDKIKIRRKSKTSIGLLVGFLGGGAAGYAIAHNAYTQGADYDCDDEGLFCLGEIVISFLGGVAGALIGLLIGGIIGKAASKGYKTYQFKGKSPYHKKQLLEKLKKRSRFKD